MARRKKKATTKKTTKKSKAKKSTKKKVSRKKSKAKKTTKKKTKASKKIIKKATKKKSVKTKKTSKPKAKKTTTKTKKPTVTTATPQGTHPLVGQNLPELTLKNASNEDVVLGDLVNSKPYCVLYFYPKDDTPGCTQEACDFRDSQPQIESKNAVVIGVSPDPVDMHKKFQEKYNLNFHLLSDPEKKLITPLGIWQKKQFMGKEMMGVVRTTLLIHNGKIMKVWQPVTVQNHVNLVLNEIRD